MSTSALQPSFGLGYLNEQQRYTHKPTQAPVVRTQTISDFSPSSASLPRVLSPTFRPVQNKIGMDVILNTRVSKPSQAQSAAIQHEINYENTDQSIIAEQFNDFPTKNFTHKLLRTAPLVVAGIAFISGLTVLGMSLKQNHQAVAQVAAITEKSETVEASVETPPSEEKVSNSAVRSHAVAADLPRTITINKINVFARVKPVNMLPSGAMATPRNTNDAGWYEGSSKPGDGGAAVIVGHVSGAVDAGVFYELKNLNIGDVVNVSRGDGKVFDYKVVKKEQVASKDVDMSELMLAVTTGKPGLNIMTCGGKYDAKNETFTDRVIVYTEQI